MVMLRTTLYWGQIYLQLYGIQVPAMLGLLTSSLWALYSFNAEGRSWVRLLITNISSSRDGLEVCGAIFAGWTVKNLIWKCLKLSQGRYRGLVGIARAFESDRRRIKPPGGWWLSSRTIYAFVQVGKLYPFWSHFFLLPRIMQCTTCPDIHNCSLCPWAIYSTSLDLCWLIWKKRIVMPISQGHGEDGDMCKMPMALTELLPWKYKFPFYFSKNSLPEMWASGPKAPTPSKRAG